MAIENGDFPINSMVDLSMAMAKCKRSPGRVISINQCLRDLPLRLVCDFFDPFEKPSSIFGHAFVPFKGPGFPYLPLNQHRQGFSDFSKYLGSLTH